MEAYRNDRLNFKKQRNKTEVSIGKGKESYIFGWIDESGLYLWSQEGKLIQLSKGQLTDLVNSIDP